MGAAILRAIGDSKRPLYFLIICCIVNIILDLVLVLGFKMGVLGVAVATLIAPGDQRCARQCGINVSYCRLKVNSTRNQDP